MSSDEAAKDRLNPSGSENRGFRKDESVPDHECGTGKVVSMEMARIALTAVRQQADLNVGSISGPIHIAAAFGVPSVVIYGGYESPSCSNYKGNRHLHTDLKCSPCWLREPCPIDRKCLRDIFPETVEKNLRELWKSGK